MEQDIAILLAKDSFLSGLILASSGEVILPSLIIFKENYNIGLAVLIAFFAKTCGLLLNYFVIKQGVKTLCAGVYAEREIRSKNPDPKTHLVNAKLWPLLLLVPAIQIGGAIAALAGLFEMPIKKALSIIVGSSAVYYISLLVYGSDSLFNVAASVIIGGLLIFYAARWFSEYKAAKTSS
jgi:membrane protein YqaA with SNARE-associated domain